MIAVAFALAAALAPPQQPARDTAAPAAAAVLRGRVLAEGPAPRPLTRVEVHAICPPLKINKGAMTDANGRYEIADLPAGRYTISFTRPNYVRANYGQRRPLGAGLPIEIADRQTVQLDDMVLQRSAAITGRVVDEFGDPATGALITTMRWALVNGERRMQQAGGGATADDRGEYRLFGLAPGQYVIAVTLRGAATFSNTVDTSSYPPTFYPGTGNPAEAQRVIVAPGQTIAGINIALQAVAAARVSGVALDAQGRPLAGANVFVTQRSTMTFEASGTVRPDGAFSIGGLPPGDYTVQANVPGAPEETAAADVVVSGSDVSDLQLVATKPSVVRGRVVFDRGGTTPPTPSTITVFAQGGRTRSAFARDDATFEVKAAAGRVEIRASASGATGWSLKRVSTSDGIDVTDSGVEVRQNGAVEGLVVEMTSNQPEISGTVVDASGAATRDCVVVVFAQDPARWKPPSRYVVVGRPDQENAFRIHVPPGDYLIAAYEDPDPSMPASDPDLLQQLRGRATPVSIAEGATRTLRVPLGAAPVY